MIIGSLSMLSRVQQVAGEVNKTTRPLPNLPPRLFENVTSAESSPRASPLIYCATCQKELLTVQRVKRILLLARMLRTQTSSKLVTSYSMLRGSVNPHSYRCASFCHQKSIDCLRIEKAHAFVARDANRSEAPCSGL